MRLAYDAIGDLIVIALAYGTLAELVLIAGDAFDPQEPRVPEGQAGGGEWTAGGSTEGTVAPIDPEIVNVGGDEWNKATAKRLALEYAKAKPMFEALAKDIGRTLKFSDLTSEEQQLFKDRYIEGRAGEFKASMLKSFPLTPEAAARANAEQKAFFNDPAKKADWLLTHAKDLYDRLPAPYKKSLADNAIDVQKLADSWYIVAGSNFMMVSLKEDMAKLRGPKAFYPGGVQTLLDQMRYDLNNALGIQWANFRDAQKPDEAQIEKDARKKATEGFEGLLNGEGAAGRDGDQVNVRIKQYVPDIWDKYAKAPIDDVVPPPEKAWPELTQEKKEEVKSHWWETNADSFEKSEIAHWKATQAQHDAEVKLAEGFNTKTTEDTYSQKWAKEALKTLFTPERDVYEHPEEKKFGFKGGTPIEYNANLPSPWEQDGHKPLPFADPAADLLKLFKIEVENGKPADDIEAMDRRLWTGWVDASTSNAGLSLQVAIAEELGGRLRTKTGGGDYMTIDPVEVKEEADTHPGGYALVKALVRAKWETTQYMLEKAGIKTLGLYRTIAIPTDLLGNATDVYTGNPHEEENRGIPAFHRLDKLKIERNGAASTTTDIEVANRWDGDDRVVLRAQVPRTTVVSVPAYGQNLHAEHEAIIAGTAWAGWDAWYGRAPKFEDVPMRKDDAAPPVPKISEEEAGRRLHAAGAGSLG